jgi:hypothetical protein
MSVIAKALEAHGLEDTSENRLALKLSWAWLEAVGCGDVEWMHAYMEAMEHFKGLEKFERLQKLYQWVKVHPPTFNE